jgi:hypothetical protein
MLKQSDTTKPEAMTYEVKKLHIIFNSKYNMQSDFYSYDILQ